MQVHHSVKSWTLLSSPKCHKVGRLQLAHRESLCGVSFELGGPGAPLDASAACALGRLLVDLSAHFGQGLLQLREASVRIPCQLHTFEAFMCLPLF